MRYKITLEYLGKGYCGWQRQKKSLSLQQVIEEAIFSFTKKHVEILVAGRTDSGVHAYGQVAHFDLADELDPKKLMLSINHFLIPHTIAVIDCERVNYNFHARFSAKKRHYVYKILNRNGKNIIFNGLKLWVRSKLDINKMQEGANFLIGKHDFTSFRTSECQANSPIRTIDRIEIIRKNDDIEIYFSALSFLHNMIRRIVGSLIMVGKKKWQPEKINTILESKDPRLCGATISSDGLYFLKVDY